MNFLCPLRRVIYFLVIALVLSVGLTQTGRASPTKIEDLHSPIVFVRVVASTFKTRDRVFYDIEGSIIKKLQSSGLQTLRDSNLPYDYTLEVLYEEQRGAEFDIGRWGTTIEGEFVFRKNHGEVLWKWKIHEVSTNDISGAPPYIDALLKFATHPNYFFLGPILKELTRPEASISKALTYALLQRLIEVYPHKEEKDPEAPLYHQDHFMDAIHVVHQDVAFQRTFDELLGQNMSKDTIVSIAKRFLHSPDPQLRVRGVTVLGQDQTHQETLRRLAMNDPNREVRKIANKLLSPALAVP